MDNVDGLGYVCEIGYIEFLTGQLFRVTQQPLHFFLRTAVTELEVVQHGVVLHGESAIRILDKLKVCAHFVRVVGHIHNRAVRIGRSLVGVVAERFNQAGRKTRGEFHVLVRRHTSGGVGICRICLYRLRGFAEQGINTADKLLIIGIGRHDLHTERYGSCGGSCGNTRDSSPRTFQNAAELFKLAARFLGGLAKIGNVLSGAAGRTAHIICCGGSPFCVSDVVSEPVLCGLDRVTQPVSDCRNRVRKTICDVLRTRYNIFSKGVGLPHHVGESPADAGAQGGGKSVSSIHGGKERTAERRAYAAGLRLQTAEIARDISDARISLRAIRTDIDSAAAALQAAKTARDVANAGFCLRRVGTYIYAVRYTAGFIHSSSLLSIFLVPFVLPEQAGLFGLGELIQIHFFKLRIGHAAHAEHKPPKPLVFTSAAFSGLAV